MPHTLNPAAAAASGSTVAAYRTHSTTLSDGGMSKNGSVNNHGLTADLPSQLLVDDLMLRLAQATEMISQPKGGVDSRQSSQPAAAQAPPGTTVGTIMIHTNLDSTAQPAHTFRSSPTSHATHHSKSEHKEQQYLSRTPRDGSDETTANLSPPLVMLQHFNPLRPAGSSPQPPIQTTGPGGSPGAQSTSPDQRLISPNPVQPGDPRQLATNPEQRSLLPPADPPTKAVSASSQLPSTIGFPGGGGGGGHGDKGSGLIGMQSPVPSASYRYTEETFETDGFRWGLFPRKWSRSFIAPIICVIVMIVAGVVVAFELYQKLHSAELSRWRDNNQNACASRAKLLQQNFGYAIAASESMAGFFTVQQRYQRDYGFVFPNSDWLLYVTQGAIPVFIDQVVFMPVVLDADRATFENVTGHNITDIDLTSKPYNLQHTRPPAPYYLPYQYKYPNFTGLPPGVELYNIDGLFLIPLEGVDADILPRTIAGGKLLFSNRQPLKKSLNDPNSSPQYGLVLTLPFYYADQFVTPTGNLTVDLAANLPHCIGMIGAVVRASVALQLSVEEADPVPFYVALYDTATKDHHTYVTEVWPDGYSSADDLDLNRNSTIIFEIGERAYELDCVPTKDYLNSAYSSTPLLVGVGAGIVVGVCIMILLCGYLILNVRRSNQRTVMLAEANSSKNAALSLLAQAKELADRANKSKSDFLAFLCHELRNPLHAISAMVDFLHQDYFATQLDKEVAGGGRDGSSHEKSSDERKQKKEKRQRASPIPIMMSSPLFAGSPVDPNNGAPRSSFSTVGENQTIPPSSENSLTPPLNGSRRRKDRSKAEAADCVGVIRSQVDLMRTIIDDCLDMSKIEAGVIQFESIGIELGVLARQCVQSLSSKCKEKGIRLRLHLDQTHLPRKVYADPTRLKQLIMNLLTNAIKFTSRGAVQLVLAATPWTIESALAAELELSPEEQQLLLQAAAKTASKTGSITEKGPSPDPNMSLDLPNAPVQTTMDNIHIAVSPSPSPLLPPSAPITSAIPPPFPSPRTPATSPSEIQLTDISGGADQLHPQTSPPNLSKRPSSSTTTVGAGASKSNLIVSDQQQKQKRSSTNIAAGGGASAEPGAASLAHVEGILKEGDDLPQFGPTKLKLQRPNTIILQVSVADSGSGIHPSALPHLFQPYSQEKLSIMRTHGGTGLGLAIVKNIVSHMHGSIQVQSEVGKGSKFTLYLPLPCRRSNPNGLDKSSSQTHDDMDEDASQTTMERLRRRTLEKGERHHHKGRHHGHNPGESDGSEQEDAIESHLLDKFERSEDFDHGLHSSDSDSTSAPPIANPTPIIHPNSFLLPIAPSGGSRANSHPNSNGNGNGNGGGSGQVSPRASPGVGSEQLHPRLPTQSGFNSRSSSHMNGGTVTFHNEDSINSNGSRSKTRSHAHTPDKSALDQTATSNEGQLEPQGESSPAYSIPSTVTINYLQPEGKLPEGLSLVNSSSGVTMTSVPSSVTSSAGATDTPPAAAPTKPTLHILLIDDAEINLKILCKMLGNSLVVNGISYRLALTTAGDGEEAMAKVEERFRSNSTSSTSATSSPSSSNSNLPTNQFHIIASDIVMPIMDGFVFARTLRQFESQHHLPPAPLIALTANALKADVDQYKAASFKWFIPKPFRKNDLTSTFQIVLSDEPTSNTVGNNST